MFAGNSAILSQVNSNIKTNRIKVEAQSGAVITNYNDVNNVGSNTQNLRVTKFGGHWVELLETNLVDFEKRYRYITNDGVSSMQDFYLATTYDFADIYNDGTTMSLFYTSGTTNMYRLTSSDGINWGDTVTVYNSNSFIYGVAAVSHTEVYLMKTGVSSVTTGYPLYAHQSGATFRLRRISKMANTSHLLDVRDRSIAAYRQNNLDTVYFKAYEGTTNNPYQLYRVVHEPGTSTIYEKEVIAKADVTSDPLIVRWNQNNLMISNLEAGNSYIYLGVAESNPNITLRKNRVSAGQGHAIWRSTDMKNWQTRISGFAADIDQTSYPYKAAAIYANTDGTTNLEYVYFYEPEANGNRTAWVSEGVSWYDLSGDIINYQNTGNERINLTLGNYES